MRAIEKSLLAGHRVRAQLLRRVSDSTALSRTMRKAVRVLAEAGIPSLVVGGYAVQENGYARLPRTWISLCRMWLRQAMLYRAMNFRHVQGRTELLRQASGRSISSQVENRLDGDRSPIQCR